MGHPLVYEPEPDALVLTGTTGRRLWRQALRRHWSAARDAVAFLGITSPIYATSPELWRHRREPRLATS